MNPLFSPFNAEPEGVDHTDRWTAVLAWAIGAVAVFGCMSFAWWNA